MLVSFLLYHLLTQRKISTVVWMFVQIRQLLKLLQVRNLYDEENLSVDFKTMLGGSASLYDEERDLSHLPRLDKPSLYAIPDSSSRRSQSSTVPPARSLSEKIINYFNTAFSNITDNELAIYEDGGEFGDMSTRHVAYDRARFNDSDRNDSKT